MARLNTPLLLAFAAASIACGSDQGVDPTPYVDGAEAPALTSLELRPATADIERGATIGLAVVAVDQRGSRMIPRVVSYSSDDPAIATVTEAGGRVTGIAPGTARISATVIVGTITQSALMTVNVRQPDPSPRVVLTSGDNGWQPAIAHVVVGGLVEWRAGPIDWAGVPNTKVWLLDATYSFVDSVDVSSGSATRRFDTPGTIRYCSGSCWDPPDFGIVFVR